MLRLETLPRDILLIIFTYLPLPTFPPPLAATSKLLRHAYFSSQPALSLPAHTRDLPHFLNLLPSHTALRDLHLTPASLSPCAAPVWSSTPPAPQVTALLLPHTPTPRTCLFEITRTLPNAVSLSTPLTNIPALPPSIETLTLTSTTQSLPPPAQSVLPLVLASLPLHTLSLTLPPRIIPNDFLAALVTSLTSASLDAFHIAIPRYPSCQGRFSRGLSRLALTSLTITTLAPHRALVAHLHLWTRLSRLTFLCATSPALGDVLAELRHRVTSVTVSRRESKSAKGGGVCAREVQRVFEQVLGKEGSMAPAGVAVLDISRSSVVREWNVLSVRLVNSGTLVV